MSVDKIHQIDATGTKGNEVYVMILEGRRWEDIKESRLKLTVKIMNIKDYLKSDEAQEKYKNKKVKIILDTQYEPPKDVKDILKKEKVILSINHSYLKK